MGDGLVVSVGRLDGASQVRQESRLSHGPREQAACAFGEGTGNVVGIGSREEVFGVEREEAGRW